MSAIRGPRRKHGLCIPDTPVGYAAMIVSSAQRVATPFRARNKRDLVREVARTFDVSHSTISRMRRRP
jgi:hypothetical protein